MNYYYSKYILKYVKDVSQIASLDWWQFILDKLITNIRHYKESKATKGVHFDNLLFFLIVSSLIQQCSPCLILPLHKPDSEDHISGTTLVIDASVIVEKEDHCEDVVLDHPNNFMKKDDSVPSYSLVLGLSTSDSQSPIPQTTSVPHPNTAGVNEDDDDEVLPEKDDEKRVGVVRTPERLDEVGPSDALRKREPDNLLLAYCSPYVIRLTKLDSELSQDELVIFEYVFGKVEDVGDSEPLFDGCSDNEANTISMATLKPGEEVKTNVIDIWSSILNEREKKRDLATSSKLFMSCDENVSCSQSSYCSIINALVVITKTLSY
ncbi:hypothetical protein Cgig2_024294 [Carnegiea gigantea]|uniref:Uncharacterized protein n=1 Tax=Carnegiea gigantea TaxID=171969 RepID=A0A9Q1GU77_9CARY|nr:hypothetical protein Cgig2_024294 [Carnegiea gigantea]